VNPPIVFDTGGLLRGTRPHTGGRGELSGIRSGLDLGEPRHEYELPLPWDLVRALELDAKFRDLAMGLVDGTMAAVAERRQVYRILTTDRRDFGAIRVGPCFARALDVRPQPLEAIVRVLRQANSAAIEGGS
jgi:hypothetical protein